MIYSFYDLYPGTRRQKWIRLSESVHIRALKKFRIESQRQLTPEYRINNNKKKHTHKNERDFCVKVHRVEKNFQRKSEFAYQFIAFANTHV